MGACAFYRRNTIYICVEKCAQPGTAGRSWSWPGYIVDRTPYGVLAHELGHSVDHALSQETGAYFGNFSRDIFRITGEEAITNYAPNVAEWWAEIFRLFVTNPALLKVLRPRTYEAALKLGLRPLPGDDWKQVLADAPERTLKAAENKIRQASVAIPKRKIWKRPEATAELDALANRV